jgi:hypothetical protein
MRCSAGRTRPAWSVLLPSLVLFALWILANLAVEAVRFVISLVR